MELHTGLSCAMARHARGAQHRGECRGPRGNGGGGGSQHPAETWGGECGSFWSQRKLRNDGDHRRCAAQIRCTEPSDIPLAHRHCPPTTSLAVRSRTKNDTSSPNRPRQRRRARSELPSISATSPSLMPIEQHFEPHWSNSSQHFCPALLAPLSGGSETDSSRATKSG
jgi:hypothetical protein